MAALIVLLVLLVLTVLIVRNVLIVLLVVIVVIVMAALIVLGEDVKRLPGFKESSLELEPYKYNRTYEEQDVTKTRPR